MNNNPKPRIYIRTCKRCNETYKTKHRLGRVCPKCIKPHSNYKNKKEEAAKC